MTNGTNLFSLADVPVKARSICPICEEGILTEHTTENHFVRLGVFVSCTSHYSVCSVCGSEQANSDQIDRNKEVGQSAFTAAIMNLQGETGNYI